jgi:hypothetical protein
MLIRTIYGLINCLVMKIPYPFPTLLSAPVTPFAMLIRTIYGLINYLVMKIPYPFPTLLPAPSATNISSDAYIVVTE